MINEENDKQRSAASIRQYITNVVINIVFYANSIRRSATIANLITVVRENYIISAALLGFF